MTMTNEEMLELAKKYGAVQFDVNMVIGLGAGAVLFNSPEQFLAYTSAIEEKYQAQINMDTECIERIRNKAAQLEIENEEQKKQIAMLRDALQYEHEWHISIEGAMGGKFKPFISTLQALDATQATSDAFIAEVKAIERAEFVQVLLAVARSQGALGLLDHLEDRAKRGEMYFIETEHITGVKADYSRKILEEVADWMDAKEISHVSANALRHYMSANIQKLEDKHNQAELRTQAQAEGRKGE